MQIIVSPQFFGDQRRLCLFWSPKNNKVMTHIKKYKFIYFALLFFIIGTANIVICAPYYHESETLRVDFYAGCISVVLGFLSLLTQSVSSHEVSFSSNELIDLKKLALDRCMEILPTANDGDRERAIQSILESDYAEKAHLEAVIRHTEPSSNENDRALEKLTKLSQ